MEETTVSGFLDLVAESSPTPGGGSVSALAGALASALVEMVAGLTLGKKGFESSRDEMLEVKRTAEAHRKALESAIAEDSKAYQSVMDAYRLPRETAEERKKRGEEIQNRLRKATEPPLLTAETSLKVMHLCTVVVKRGNPSAMTDAAVASLLAQAAVQGGILNVMVNLLPLKQDRYVEQVKNKLKSMQEPAERVVQEVMAVVKERLGHP